VVEFNIKKLSVRVECERKQEIPARQEVFHGSREVACVEQFATARLLV
jgi:hypothetical protein